MQLIHSRLNKTYQHNQLSTLHVRSLTIPQITVLHWQALKRVVCHNREVQTKIAKSFIVDQLLTICSYDCRERLWLILAS